MFNHPYNLFVATFIGTPQMNMFDNAKLVKRTVKFAFPGHVCHVFSKETGVNLEA